MLLLGRNGAGKTSVADVFLFLRDIGRGEIDTGKIGMSDGMPLSPLMLWNGRRTDDEPMRFEIDVALGESLFSYGLSFELPQNFNRFRDSTAHIGKPGGGKVPTICQLAEWMPDLRRYPNRKVLFVLDSDSREGTVTNIWERISKVVEDSLDPCFRAAAPERLSTEKQNILNRIFPLLFKT